MRSLRDRSLRRALQVNASVGRATLKATSDARSDAHPPSRLRNWGVSPFPVLSTSDKASHDRASGPSGLGDSCLVDSRRVVGFTICGSRRLLCSHSGWLVCSSAWVHQAKWGPQVIPRIEGRPASGCTRQNAKGMGLSSCRHLAGSSAMSGVSNASTQRLRWGSTVVLGSPSCRPNPPLGRR